jgi:hypothetical protein
MNRTFRMIALAAVTAALLSSCGGGGEEGDVGGGTGQPPPDTDWITWNGSANGEVVKDRNNEDFRVRASTRVVVFQGGNARLNGTYVDDNARLLINGVHVGSVSYATSTTGSQITVFRCTNGNVLDFYNDSATMYAWLC